MSHTLTIHPHPSSILSVDLYSSGAVVELFRPDKPSHIYNSALELGLKSLNESPTGNRTRYCLGGKPFDAFRKALWRMVSRHKLNLEQTSLVLGCRSDPFIPFAGKFDSALKVIDFLAGIPPRMLCVQTRSPLAILALPRLRSLGNRALSTIYLESHNNSLSKTIFPKLPYPEERLSAARSLADAGLKVAINVCPVKEETKLQSYAEKLNKSGIFVCFDRQSLPPCLSLANSQRLKAMFSVLSPEKIIPLPYSTWLLPAPCLHSQNSENSLYSTCVC